MLISKNKTFDFVINYHPIFARLVINIVWLFPFNILFFCVMSPSCHQKLLLEFLYILCQLYWWKYYQDPEGT